MLKILSNIFKVSIKISQKMENNLFGTINHFRYSTNRQAQKTGYLLSGDQAGYDISGLKDYSSLMLPDSLTGAELSYLSLGSMTLGQIKHPRKKSYPFTLNMIQIFLSMV